MLKDALRDSFIYGLAFFFSKGLSIFLTPLYAHFLSTQEYGAFDLLTTIAALASLIVALEVSQGLARHFGEAKTEQERRKLTSTVFYFSIATWSLFLLGCLYFSKNLNNIIFGSLNYLLPLQMSIISTAFGGIYILLLNQFRWELRSKDYAALNLTYAAVLLITTWVACTGYRLGLVGVICAQLLTTIICVAIGFWSLRASFGAFFDARALREMLRFSLPLIPSGLAIYFSLYANRLAIIHYGSLGDVALYGMANRIASIILFLLMGIQGALTPLIYQNYQKKETPLHLAKLFNWFAALAILGCLFLATFAKEILWLLTKPEYASASSLIAILAPALLFSQMYIFSPGIAIAKKTHLQLLTTSAASIASIFANILLVPRFGALGAAAATLFSSLIFFFCWSYFSQKYYPIPFAKRGLVLATVCGIFFIIFSFVADSFQLSYPLHYITKVILLMLAFSSILYFELISKFEIKMAYVKLKQSFWGRI
jgi:O-antigen/teichoic acid export membrane protein